jgi:S1-C subfamily serine protease
LAIVLTLGRAKEGNKMKTLLIFLLTSLSIVSAAQEALTPHRAQHPTLTTRQLHQWAISRTVLIVAGPNTPVQSLGSGVWVSKGGFVATCWHVVENADEIQVKIAYPGVYDLENHVLVNAAFALYAATVVVSDKNADVAILKVSPNPFVTPPGVQQIVSGTPAITFASADLRTSLPNPDDLALVSGYPLGRPDLLTQRGTVAAVALVDSFGGPETSKGVRILLSLVSNPGNSGGPVFDSDGKVLGLLRGNFEWTPTHQNSGISIVVPAYFVQNALDQAEGKAPAAAKTKGAVIIQGLQVISAPPDTEPKVASSLAPAELKRQTASFLVMFRSFLSQQDERQRQLSEGFRPDLTNRTTEEERQAASARLSNQFLALQEEMKQQYHARFKPEAMRLRDDFWARLPVGSRNPQSVLLYDYGHDLYTLRHLADDLERLSKILPEQ